MNGELEAAHQASANHADDIDDETECGCFYCLSTFKGADITDWIDDGSTANCPRCGMNAVLPDPALPNDLTLTDDLLADMNGYWY